MTQPILYIPNVIGLPEYRPYGKRRSILDHVQNVLETYASHLPLTVRQIYYRLVATHTEYPKEQKFYRMLVDTLALARRGGIIDFSAIRDDGVRIEHCGTGYAGLDHFQQSMLSYARGYTRDKFRHQPKQIFVLCEAAGMVPQIVRACGNYPVTVQSSGGMDSVTAKFDLARNCADEDSVVLHVGDFDPTGLSIFHQLALDVPKMIDDYCQTNMELVPSYECKRVTILDEHVRQFGLLTGRTKATDDSKRWYPGIGGNPHATCEVEALPPDVLMSLVRRAIEAELDLDIYQADAAKEEAERLAAINAVSSLSIGGAR